MADFIKVTRLPIRKPNKQKIFKYVHQRLIRLWKDSVKEFLTVAMEKVHIDTGMSISSFYPLGTKVRMGSLINTLVKTVGRKKKPGHKGLRGRWASNNAKYKSASFGRKLGKKAYHLSFGTQVNPLLKFEFEIVVFQHFMHEDNWDDLILGQEAFIEHFERYYTAYVSADHILGFFTGE